jgi:hypothetical protein
VQDADEAVGAGIDVLVLVLVGGSSPSRQPPNQPGYSQVDVAVSDDEVVVAVGAGAGDVVCKVDVVFSPLSSLQPNQPGVLHVDVEEVEVDFVEVFVPVVVDSSRHPNQPGVLQVAVRVRVLVVVDVIVGLEVVVVSLPLLSKYCQL